MTHLLDHAQITRKEAAEVIAQGKSKSHLVLRRLVTKGLVTRRGQGRGTCYVLAHKTKGVAEDPLFRNWTDAKGTYQIAARFIDFRDNQVIIERKVDLKTIELPFSRLCKNDQIWVREKIQYQTEKEHKVHTGETKITPK